MCPLCIATGTIAFAGASSAGGLGAIAARIRLVRRKRADQKSVRVAELATTPRGESPGRWVSCR